MKCTGVHDNPVQNGNTSKTVFVDEHSGFNTSKIYISINQFHIVLFFFTFMMGYLGLYGHLENNFKTTIYE